ncbi:MAG: MATE family efflux transporter [Bacteroides sp.]|nr:MATE family efflux transporter [Bacteroides sp.]MCM1446944.1 MATE family efflux transporter [Bacteroides sp.]
MHKTSYINEYKHLIKLGLPITIAQVGLTLQGMADTLMLGRHSATDLAAAGFSNSILIMGQLLGMGFCMAAVPSIGSLYSQRRYQDIVSGLKSSLFADIMQGLLVCLLVYVAFFAVPHMGLEPHLLSPIRTYMAILIPSLLVMNVCTGMKTFYDCLTDTRITMWIVLSGNLWNILWNWILIFGNMGFPAMGIEGAAWATASSRILMLGIYVGCFLFNRRYSVYRSLWRTATITRTTLVRHNRLGWPIALQQSLELAAFSGCALALGRGGISWDATSALDAHQVGIQLSSFIYMFYLGIGSAVSIRVAHYHGLGGWNGIRHSAHAGYHLIVCVGIVATGLVYTFRHHLAGIFISGEAPELFTTISNTVVAMVCPIIFYQVGDGMQSCYVNALRGIGDVKKLLKYSFICYGIVSIPLSFLFGIVMDHGTVGIWWGFPVGLTLAGGLYLRRFRWHLKQHGR